MKHTFALLMFSITLFGLPISAETIVNRFEPGINHEVLQLVARDNGPPLLLTIERNANKSGVAKAQSPESLKVQALDGAAFYSLTLPAARTLTVASSAFPPLPQNAVVFVAEGATGLLKTLSRTPGERRDGPQAEKRVAAPAHIQNVFLSKTLTFITWREGASPRIGFIRITSADEKIEPITPQADRTTVAIEDATQLNGSIQILTLNTGPENQEFNELELSSYAEGSPLLTSRRKLAVPPFKFGSAKFVHGRGEPTFIVVSSASTLAGERQWTAMNAVQPNATAFPIGSSSPEARDFAAIPACNGSMLVTQLTKSEMTQSLSLSLVGPAKRAKIIP